jgi:hypothetical protein
MRPIGVNRGTAVYNMIVRRSPKEDHVVDPTTEAIDETLRQITALEKDVCYAELDNRPPEVVVTLEARLRTLRSQLAALEAVNPERSF